MSMRLVLIVIVIFFIKSLPLCGQGFSFYEYYSPTELGNSSPQNWVALQDTNGYLFIGNGGGYLVSDGKSWSFEHIGETGRGNSFFLNSTGQFYANGSYNFGVIVPNRLNKFEYKSISSDFYTEDEYVPYIWEVYEIDGKIYNRHNYGITEYDPVYNKLKEFPLKENELWHSFRIDNKIIVDANDGLWTFEDSSFARIPDTERFEKERMLFSLKISSETILIGTYRQTFNESVSELLVFRNGNLSLFKSEADSYISTHIAFKAINIDNNTIAIATLTGGIVFITKSGRLIKIFNSKNGLNTNEVYNLYKDAEDQLWILLSDGVQKLDLNTFILNYGEVHGLEGIIEIEEVVEVKGTIWVISESEVYKSTVLDTERTIAFVQLQNPFGIPIIGLFSYKEKIYVYGSMGIYELWENGVGEQVYNKAVTSHALNLEENKLLLTGKNTLLTFDGSSITEQKVNLDGNVIYSAFFEDELFVILSNSKNIYKVKSDSLVEVNIQKDDSKIINYNDMGIIDNELYIGTDGLGINNGLFVFNKNTKEFKKNIRFGEDTPLNKKQVFKFEQCENGDVWFSADIKIIKAAKKEQEWELISIPFKKVSDFEAYSFECTKGGVWVGGIKSLTFIKNDTKIDSTKFKTNITGVFVERDSLIYGGYGEPKEAFNLPFKNNELRFSYAAASFIDAKKNTYSVKLEGFENTWSNWSLESQKDYTNIPEGTYTFKVRSRNMYNYEGTPDEFVFTVLPPWYRTLWAYLAYVLMICGGIYLIYKIRINQLLRVQQVRNRIADDLHDDLSGTLIGISNFAKAISRNPDKEFQQRFIELIEKSADEAKEKISDIVWTINPQHDQWTNFLTKCRRHASDIFAAQEIEYLLEMDDSITGEPTMEVRKNLWLVFKEILTNIIKHSNADYVLVRFTFDRNTLTIFIKDNGTGFDMDTIEKGNGIKNIRNRVSTIGGKLKLVSKSGEGTAWKIVAKI